MPVLQKEECENRNQNDVDDVSCARNNLTAQTLDVRQNVFSAIVEFGLQGLRNPGANWFEHRWQRKSINPLTIPQKLRQLFGQVVGLVGNSRSHLNTKRTPH